MPPTARCLPRPHPDIGLSAWRTLDRASSDNESIELDRLCRVLHAIDFFCQSHAQGADLYLGMHDRLLAGMSTNHGDVFFRLLTLLELPSEQIVLQLLAIGPDSRWLANDVAAIDSAFAQNRDFQALVLMAWPAGPDAKTHEINGAAQPLTFEWE